jgi:hypothetical protein
LNEFKQFQYLMALSYELQTCRTAVNCEIAKNINAEITKILSRRDAFGTQSALSEVAEKPHFIRLSNSRVSELQNCRTA